MVSVVAAVNLDDATWSIVSLAFVGVPPFARAASLVFLLVTAGFAAGILDFAFAFLPAASLTALDADLVTCRLGSGPSSRSTVLRFLGGILQVHSRV